MLDLTQLSLAGNKQECRFIEKQKCVKCICTCHWLHSACSLSCHPAQLMADALLQQLSESAAPQQLDLQ